MKYSTLDPEQKEIFWLGFGYGFVSLMSLIILFGFFTFLNN